MVDSSTLLLLLYFNTLVSNFCYILIHGSYQLINEAIMLLSLSTIQYEIYQTIVF